MGSLKIIIRKITTLVNNPKVLLIKLVKFMSPVLNDKLYLQLLFPLRVGYKLDLENPKTYNQKLQWLKLYNKNPLLNVLVDKYEVKKYVAETIGEEYVIKNYGLWNSFDEIDFDQLPSQFVLKTTHDSGGVVICKNKSELDHEKARKKLEMHLQKTHFFLSREWPYKDVKPRIIAEEYLVDESKVELKDYKFFCFDGECKALFIATERSSGDVKFDFFDIEFNHLDIVQFHKQSGKVADKPKNFELMVELSKNLSKGLEHVRVDFYNIDGKILFGECTFFHHGGLEPFSPKEWDYKFGEWINLQKLIDTKSR